MCGIAGLYTKTTSLQGKLGALLAQMLEQLSFRGPDSAGAAFYRAPAAEGFVKVSLDGDWQGALEALAARYDGLGDVQIRGGQATVEIAADAGEAQRWLADAFPA